MSLCLSFFVEDADTALAHACAAVGQAHWVELRLDRAPDVDLQQLVHEMPLPVIAACILESEGGEFTGTAEQRAALLLDAAHAGARFIDLPLGVPRPAELPDRTGVVHSWHERPGENADLRVKLHHIEAELEPGDVAKVVCWADDHLSALRIAALYGTTRAPLIAFAQGPGGRATRAWAPVLGAPWTYACLPDAPTGAAQWSLPELVALMPPGGANPQTNLYGVVGNPIAHSRSPLLWNFAFRMSQMNAFYLPIELDSFDGLLHAHRTANFQGFSITAPFKRAALAAAAEADPVATAAGAANTLMRGRSGWRALNTDGAAALDALEAAGAAAPGPLLIIGAGGAARATVFEAARRGYAVHVAARRAEAAAELVPIGAAAPSCTAGSLEDAAFDGFAAVVQATPVGSAHTPGNLGTGKTFAPGAVVLDMVYDPAQTEWLAQAHAQGAVVVPGSEMLLRQMMAQFRMFTGTELPLEPLRQTLAADLSPPR